MLYFLRFCLFPIAFFYKIGFLFSRMLYTWGFRKTYYNNDIYSICIGNLSMGGTGKTPHIVFFIKKFSFTHKLAVLSRGYGRKSKGVKHVSEKATAEQVGDEPLLLKQQCPEVAIWVAERRAEAIPSLLAAQPDTTVLLLDDALQHWAFHSQFKILLTSYHRPFYADYLVPMGSLREPRAGYQRADMIIVSQCPSDLAPTQAAKIKQQINPLPHQALFFSSYSYGKLYLLDEPSRQIFIETFANYTFIIIVAIAQTKDLEAYLRQYSQQLIWLPYADHHFYQQNDLEKLQQSYQQQNKSKTIIITTEKDATKLQTHQDYIRQHELPLFVLPIEIEILFGEEAHLLQKIISK